MSISGIPRYFPLTLLCVYHVIFSLSRILGNLILNWPKLLRPLKTVFFHLISMCMCSQCDSTSLPVQRSQI